MTTPDHDVSAATLLRFERKLDQLNDAVSKLILLEERQITQAARLAVVESHIEQNDARIARTDAKVEKWVNRGWGIWAVVTILATAVLALIVKLK